jgi:IS30 family transposase
MALCNVSIAQTKAVEDKLNNRPGKVPGYLTPNEVLSETSGVALAT